MASEGTTSLAPPQGVPDDYTVDFPHGVPDYFTVDFTLRWPSGAVVGEFTGTGIESFLQDLNEGFFPGVTRAARDPGDADGDENCVFGYYVLLWGTIQLNDGGMVWFCDYDMPDGAEVTLVLRRTDTVADA